MKKFKAHQLEFDEIINTTTSNEFAKKITMVSTTDANSAATAIAADANAANEQRGNEGHAGANDGIGARLQGGNDGAEARDAAEHNGNNRNNDSRGNNNNNGDGNDNGGDDRNEGETTSTYIYQDFAQTADNNDHDDDDEDVNDVTAGNKQSPNQKLPKKLAAMLCDPDLVTCITWMPHGRSWKILNRDLFSRYALPKYFGHTNHASFIRIVNAWGFRRIIQPGPDRDTYYHELFLRSKPKLHNRMKRLPTTHRKTPMDKDECAPNFYELSERSPLPETVWERRSESGGIGMMSGGGHPTNNVRIGMSGGMMDGYVVGSSGGGGGMMRMAHQQMIVGGGGQSAAAAAMGGMMHPGMNPMMMPPSRPATASAAASPFVYPPPDGAGGSYVPSNLTRTSATTTAAGKQPPQDKTTTASTTATNNDEKERLIHLQKENDNLMRQLLELSSKLSSKLSSSSNNNKEEGGSSSTTEDVYAETVVTALQRDNERLIHEIMSLQEQLPVELRMDIHAELFDQSSGGEEESSKKKKAD